MRIIPLLIIGTLVMFFAGLIAPRRSKRLQRWVDERLKKGRQKGRRNAGKLGDWTAKSLAWGQKLLDGAARLGRRLRDRLPA